MLTRDDYLARAAADEQWAPGWLAIDEAFEALYPGVTPTHLATDFHARAVVGGTQYLDGYSLYRSPNGYFHLVTYGMSALYADEESFGGEHSGWGYELTMKVRADTPDDCMWAVNVLAAYANYTFAHDRWMEPYQFINGQGQPIAPGSGTALTSFLIVPDTEVAGRDTVHGRVDFLQLVGITQGEVDWAAAQPKGPAPRGKALVPHLAAAGNPHLVTDLTRTQSVV